MVNTSNLHFTFVIDVIQVVERDKLAFFFFLMRVLALQLQCICTLPYFLSLSLSLDIYIYIYIFLLVSFINLIGSLFLFHTAFADVWCFSYCYFLFLLFNWWRVNFPTLYSWRNDMLLSSADEVISLLVFCNDLLLPIFAYSYNDNLWKLWLWTLLIIIVQMLFLEARVLN